MALNSSRTGPPRSRVKRSQGPREQQKIKFAKGYGKPLAPESIAKRHQQFLRQQRENKVKVVSLVRRGEQRGRVGIKGAPRRGVDFKRGRVIDPERLKQTAEYRQLTIIKRKAVTSSWVKEIQMVMFNGQPALAVVFNNGFKAVYPTTNVRDYEAMSRAASKGKYVWAALYHGKPGRGAPYFKA